MDKKRTLALQLIIAIGLTGASAGHIHNAVKSHETLWIVITSVEALCFFSFGCLVVYMMIKNNKKAF